MIRAIRDLPHRCCVVEEIEPSYLRQVRDNIDPIIPVSVLTPGMLDLLSYAPSTLHRINREHGLDFPSADKQSPLREEEQLRRQLEVDALGHFCVLDGAAQRGPESYNSPGYIDSKAGALQRLLKIQARVEHGQVKHHYNPDHFEVSSSPGILVTPSELDVTTYHPTMLLDRRDNLRFLYQAKHTLNGIIQSSGRRVPGDHHRTENRRESLGFTDELKDLFGEDIAVVLFGSSAHEDSREKANDYDTIAIVPELEERHFRALEGKQIKYEGRNVDVVLVPQRGWYDLVAKNPNALELLTHSVVLEGDVEYPSANREESVLRTMARNVGRLRMLSGIALNWAYFKPEDLAAKEGIVSSLTKIPRYMLGALWQLRDLREGRDFVAYSKAALNEGLEATGLAKRQSSTNPENVKNILLELIADTDKIIREHHTKAWVDRYRDRIDQLNRSSEDSEGELVRMADRERRLREELGLHALIGA